MVSPRSIVSSRSVWARSSQRPTAAMWLAEIKIAPFEIGGRETGRTPRARRSNFLFRKEELALVAADINLLRSLLPADSVLCGLRLCACGPFACYDACEVAVRVFLQRYR